MTAVTRARLMEDPGFGKVFTDHMALVHWTREAGWSSARIDARAPFSLDPAASVLHYAQTIFEGMKAYRADNGDVLLFRPLENARRFSQSARHLAMPEIPEDLFIEAVESLVRVDREWIPESPGALYLRPMMFASEAFLGVRPASEYVFAIIACSVGPYFKGGAKPISVWVTEDHIRAAPGGTGAAKCGGNYAASMRAQADALAKKCDQVVFLDAVERKWVEELGGMNVMFVFDDGTLRTPPLGGTILAGVTRNSLLTLARDMGLGVEEKLYSFAQWKADAASGRLKEAFACGTAAVVAAIGQVRSQDGDFAISGGGEGPVTIRLREGLTAIQFGAQADRHGWVHRLDGALT
jgi:branched-chain amino acid aminotransferase